MGWPTTSEPRDNFLTMRLTDAEKAEVEAYIAFTGEDKSTATRNAMFTTIRAAMPKTAPKKTKGKKP